MLFRSHVEGIATQLRGGRLSVRTERYAGADRAIVDVILKSKARIRSKIW